jgi:hypothetical protein
MKSIAWRTSGRRVEPKPVIRIAPKNLSRETYGVLLSEKIGAARSSETAADVATILIRQLRL